MREGVESATAGQWIYIEVVNAACVRVERSQMTLEGLYLVRGSQTIP